MDENFFKIKVPEMFSLELSLDCGQAFRWRKTSDGFMNGVIGNREYCLCEKNGELLFNCSMDEFDNVLRPYFDFDRDYKILTDCFSKDKNLSAAVKEFPGIRILKQDEWETLCSFIISQNNNIPRIKGIIDRFCYGFGEEINNGVYAFPKAEKIAALSPEDLAPLRAGFRAKYIIDAARKVTCKEVDFEKIRNGTLLQGRDELIKIKGVGDKVAMCTLLYGFAKTDAFPIDVWVKRIMSEMYPNGLPEYTKGYEGIAQQYLFHWRRNSIQFAK